MCEAFSPARKRAAYEAAKITELFEAAGTSDASAYAYDDSVQVAFGGRRYAMTSDMAWAFRLGYRTAPAAVVDTVPDTDDDDATPVPGLPGATYPTGPWPDPQEVDLSDTTVPF